MTDRKFKAGDKVRWYTVDGEPLWSFDAIYGKGDDGHWEEGIVSMPNDYVFLVGDWWWPQPDDSRSRYGEPGYLELVEAVPEKMFRVVDTLDARSIYIEDGECTALSAFPKFYRPELEALCKKLNEWEV